MTTIKQDQVEFKLNCRLDYFLHICIYNTIQSPNMQIEISRHTLVLREEASLRVWSPKTIAKPTAQSTCAPSRSGTRVKKRPTRRPDTSVRQIIIIIIDPGLCSLLSTVPMDAYILVFRSIGI